MHTISTALILFITTVPAESHISLLDHFNYMAGQNSYATHAFGHQHTPFSLESIASASFRLAASSCQESFRWDRWNCPESDFILRRTSKTVHLDREDAYVNAITTAAILYTITKNCSSGIIPGCVSCTDNPYTSQCSDDPTAAIKLYAKYIKSDFPNHFYGRISKHNYEVVTYLLEKSLVEQCICSVMGANGICLQEMCLQILKPFEDIAIAIRRMYDGGLQLTNTPEVSRIMWNNIPLDSLIYITDSPNYCEPDAVPNWNGLRNRPCTSGEHSDTLSDDERQHCRHLCHECGYTTRAQNVVTESRCNCKFTWGFQVHCEKCVAVHRQYYCF